MKRLILAAFAAACLFVSTVAIAGTEGFTPVKCLTRPWLCR